MNYDQFRALASAYLTPQPGNGADANSQPHSNGASEELRAYILSLDSDEKIKAAADNLAARIESDWKDILDRK